MLFYRFSGLIDKSENGNDTIAENKNDEATHRILINGRDYNRTTNGKNYSFICRIKNNVVTGGIIVLKQEDSLDCLITKFMDHLEMELRQVNTEEVTFEVIDDMLYAAEREGYISETSDVLFELNLDKISGRYSRQQFFNEVECKEKIFKPASHKEDLLCMAERLLAKKTLQQELNNIFIPKTVPGAKGHPVHYFVESDDEEIGCALCDTLLQALYANNRISSRRYLYFEVTPEIRIPVIKFKQYYNSCIGGAVVIRMPYGDEGEESDYSYNITDRINFLTEMIYKYCNDVLTIVFLPRVCDATKKMFYENLGGISMVEIKEDISDYTSSCKYFKMMAKEYGIRTDKKLLEKLDNDKEYYPDELKSMFSDWYSEKLKTKVYPQYSGMIDCRKRVLKDKNRGKAYDELMSMVGLTEAKKLIDKAIAFCKMGKLYQDMNIPESRLCMHMVFTGNPGTAKTSVARLFARIMKENDVLSTGKFVEVGRSDLVAKYVGWTAKSIKEKFKEAKGGVLFIDEAYSLIDDRNGSFGDEAINTIVQEMENLRNEVVVIFAGYPEEMKRFLDRNPGLRSRVSFNISFNDYDTAELCDIAELLAKEKGITISIGAMTKMRRIFNLARMNANFGNGRFVRSLLESCEMNMACRVMKLEPGKVTKGILTTIQEEDVEEPTEEIISAKRVVGFV